jgi:septum formation protein
MQPPRLVLASASPARLATLRQAGLNPEVIVSGVDETGVAAGTPAELAGRLAQLKAEAVADRLGVGDARTTVLVGCDSVLELDGEIYGKPGQVEVAEARWRRMRGRSGVLHTGHHVIVLHDVDRRTDNRAAATRVHFAAVSDDEIAAYVATGEPLEVAGGFTIDGLGGPFVSGIEGDHHNVVGISLPLLRTMLAGLGVPWPSLWTARRTSP